MVDVGTKPATGRRAVAGGRITMSADALDAIRRGNAPKGDVLSTARIAGIMAAKRTHELIPLCHQLPLDGVKIGFEYDDNNCSIHVTATVKVTHKTGVEMEALTAVSVACLTIYDMTKALSHDITISDIRLLTKTGGKSDYANT